LFELGFWPAMAGLCTGLVQRRLVSWLTILVAVTCAVALAWSFVPALSWGGSDEGFWRGAALVALIGVGATLLGAAVGRGLRPVLDRFLRVLHAAQDRDSIMSERKKS
jgi:peptidoglycan/LPS O-acetylase OafA/YrhL